MGVSAVLFDLDNTLTPRQACIERFADLFAAYWGWRLAPVGKTRLREVLVRADGGGYNPRRAWDLLARLRWLDAPSTAELEHHWQTQLPFVAMLRPGVRELLAELSARGTKLGCVTNGSVAGQQAKLDHLELTPLFDAIVISEAIGCKKPEPRIFEAAVEMLDVEPGETWFVGDHPVNDVLGAGRFGMRAVWLRAGHEWPEEEPPAPHVIDAFDDLWPLLGLAA